MRRGLLVPQPGPAMAWEQARWWCYRAPAALDNYIRTTPPAHPPIPQGYVRSHCKRAPVRQTQ